MHGHIKLNMEVNSTWGFGKALDVPKEYFDYQLKSTGLWSETLSGRASALSLFLLRAAHYGRLLKFSFRISEDSSAEHQKFIQYVTSRNSPLDRRNGKKTVNRLQTYGWFLKILLSCFRPSNIGTQ
ncbi:MAG: hypothetical protein IPK68_22750 [Bdellovibrionales bacterium]|nr:hypothetical protein [Bdellovibrionales bacterium]